MHTQKHIIRAVFRLTFGAVLKEAKTSGGLYLKSPDIQAVPPFPDDQPVVSVPFQIMWELWLQKDGASPHSGRQVTAFLNQHFQKPSVLEQNQNIRIANESYENVAIFKHLETTLTNQNDIHDEIKSRLNSENGCYHSVLNLLSSRLI
jgi:hypothetical protein